MAKFTAFVILVILRISYPSAFEPTEPAPFASPSPLPASTISIVPANLISINGSITNKKVVRNWIVSENETAEQFEVEKSTDGKNFSMAALVFGTDKPETGNYQFYEKAGNHKVSYRIKLINKNKQTEYSAIVEIVPNV